MSFLCLLYKLNVYGITWNIPMHTQSQKTSISDIENAKCKKRKTKRKVGIPVNSIKTDGSMDLIEAST